MKALKKLMDRLRPRFEKGLRWHGHVPFHTVGDFEVGCAHS